MPRKSSLGGLGKGGRCKKIEGRQEDAGVSRFTYRAAGYGAAANCGSGSLELRGLYYGDLITC